MPETKHFVYSARTTEKGLSLLNKTKGDRSWDSFLNEAMADHYKLDLNVIALPPSEFIANREKAKAQKAADKAAKVAKAAEAKAKKDAAKKTGGKKTEPAAEEKPASEPPKAPKARKTVTVKPGETVKTKGGTRVTAAKENTHPVETPVED